MSGDRFSSGPSVEAGLVSVVIPCWNAAPFLDEAIGSVLAQRYPAVETIVVDDGSTDQSVAVAAAYGARISRLNLPSRRGAPAARNAGAAQARGAFLLFLDADDRLGPDAVAGLVAAATGVARGIAYCDWARLRPVGSAWIESRRERGLPRVGKDPLHEWLGGRWLPPCALIWRRDAYALTGGWDERVTANQDGDLALRAFARGARLVRAAWGRAYYRAHEGRRPSLSGDITSVERFRSRMQVLEHLERELGAAGRLDAYRTDLGIAYQRLAAMGWRDHPALARECLRRGYEHAGRRAVGATPLGRAGTWVLGLERKEQFAAWLARLGIATRGRWGTDRLRRAGSAAAEAGPGQGA